MQRVNKSAHAPLGTAFFLFLGVAIIPVSLRLAGVQTSFSPRLSAAIDAWHQIAEVFGASYRPGTEIELSALNDVDSQPSETSDATACTRRELACAREVLQPFETSLEVSEPALTKIQSSRAICPKTAFRRSPVKQDVESKVAALAIQAKEHGRVFEALGNLKVETKYREGLLKSIEKQISLPGFETPDVLKMLAIPENLRMLIRVKAPMAPSAAKTAACRVRSAFASDRRYERARALTDGAPSAITNPENSEL